MLRQWQAAPLFHSQQIGVLWRIETPNAAPSYLLGTIHTDDPRITRLPVQVVQAFDSANSFSGEVLMDEQAMGVFGSYMFYSDDTDLATMLEPALYERVVQLLLKRGFNRETIRRAKPWTVVLTLSVPKTTSGVFLDQMLFQNARGAGKPVFGLESVEEQARYFDDLPLATQLTMLKDTIHHYDAYPRHYEQLINAYLQRDLNALERLGAKQMRLGDPTIADLFQQRFVVERNKLMLERMRPRLEEGNAFIAVGALHLPGQQGLLQLLHEQGYRVTSIY